MLKKVLAVIFAVLIASGIAITCFIVFAPKTVEFVAVNALVENDKTRGEFYKLTAECSYKFTAKTKTKYYDVSAEYEAVLGGSDVKMYFLEVKDGQESIYALSMLDLASSFISASVKGEEVIVRTSAVFPLYDNEFKYDKTTLKYYKEYIDNKEYTVIDGNEKKTMIGADIKAKNVEREKSAYFTLTVNDVKNSVSKTVNFWVMHGGANKVILSAHRLTF